MKITKVRSFIVNGKKYLDSLSIVTFHNKIVFEGKKNKIRFKFSLSNCHMEESCTFY